MTRTGCSTPLGGLAAVGVTHSAQPNPKGGCVGVELRGAGWARLRFRNAVTSRRDADIET